MKKLISLLLIIFCLQNANAQLNFGNNQGYYGSQLTNKNLGTMAKNAGSNVNRLFLNIQDYLTYGVSSFHNDFVFGYDSLGFRNNILNLGAEIYSGTYTGQDTTTIGGHRTWLPKGLYLNPFNIDSSINTSNILAAYVSVVYTDMGYAFKYVECWNEPDAATANFQLAAYDSTQYSLSWQKYSPNGADLTNLYAPNGMSDYVQVCKVIYQVVKHINPNAKICTGGIGSPYFYYQFLKAGGGQWVDILDYHTYPYFNNSWYPSILHKNSDFDASWAIDSVLNGGHSMGNYTPKNFRYAETANSVSAKPAIITETNIPEWNYSTDTSYLGQQRGYPQMFANYGNKIIAEALLNGLMTDSLPFTMFALGNSEDSAVTTSSNENNAMGWYNNLTTHTITTATLTPQGFASAAIRRLLKNYRLDGTQPTWSTGIKGVRLDSAGNKIYWVWANQYAARNGDSTITASYAVPTGANAKYSYNGTSLGTPSGTQTISDPVYYLVPSGTSVTANAGTNQTVTLPTNSVSLSASGSTVVNSTITSYQWSQTSGPSTANFSAATSVNTLASSLIQGTYIFAVKVKNAAGDSSTASVTITVNPAVTPPAFMCVVRKKRPSSIINLYAFVPSFIDKLIEDYYYCANQGATYGIALPVNSITLGHLATGAINGYLWNQVSGPSVATISSPAKDTSNFTNLIAGTYIFKLKATGINNQSASVQDTVIVAPAPVVSNIIVAISPLTNGVIKGGSNITFTITGSAIGSGSVVLWDNPAKSYSLGTKPFTKTSSNAVTVTFRNQSSDLVFKQLGAGPYVGKITVGKSTVNINFNVSYN